MNFASIGPLDLQVALLVDSIWRPFRARLSEVIVPGLKPWAEFSSPFGACPSGPRNDRRKTPSSGHKTSRASLLRQANLTLVT
jgi:hypothetical protein